MALVITTFFLVLVFQLILQTNADTQVIYKPARQPFVNCSRSLDICFVVDASLSICEGDPKFNRSTDTTCGNWQSLIQFIHNICDQLKIGYDDTRVALVLFATKASMRWSLTRYTNKSRLLQAVDEIPFTAGRTNTSGALDIMRTKVFTPPADRPETDNVAIIITDGKPTNISAIPQAVQDVQNAGIRTFVVGVTDDIDEKTCKSMSSEPKELGKTYFMVNDFNVLGAVINSVQTEVCREYPYPTESSPSPTPTDFTTEFTTTAEPTTVPPQCSDIAVECREGCWPLPITDTDGCPRFTCYCMNTTTESTIPSCPTVTCIEGCDYVFDSRGCLTCDCSQTTSPTSTPSCAAICDEGCEKVVEADGSEMCFCAQTCENVICSSCEECVLQKVQCFKAPCYPQPTCVPKKSTCNETRECPMIKCAPDCQPGVGPDGCTVCDCPPNCEGFECAEDEECILKEVRCVTTPCPPRLTCVPKHDVCTSSPSTDHCGDREDRWTYIESENICKKFDYYGCLPSLNTFKSRKSCEKKCSRRGTFCLENACDDDCYELMSDNQCPRCICPNPCKKYRCSKRRTCKLREKSCDEPPCEIEPYCACNHKSDHSCRRSTKRRKRAESKAENTL